MDGESDGDGSESRLELELHTPLRYVPTFRCSFVARVSHADRAFRRLITWGGMTALTRFEAHIHLKRHNAVHSRLLRKHAGR